MFFPVFFNARLFQSESDIVLEGRGRRGGWVGGGVKHKAHEMIFLYFSYFFFIFSLYLQVVDKSCFSTYSLPTMAHSLCRIIDITSPLVYPIYVCRVLCRVLYPALCTFSVPVYI